MRTAVRLTAHPSCARAVYQRGYIPNHETRNGHGMVCVPRRPASRPRAPLDAADSDRCSHFRALTDAMSSIVMARRPALRCTWNQRATTPASSIEVPLHPHLWKYHGPLIYGRSQQRNYASRYDQQRNYASRYDEQKTDGSRSRTAPRLATQFASSHHERTTPRVNTWAWEPPPEPPPEPSDPQSVTSHAPDCRVHNKLCS